MTTTHTILFADSRNIADLPAESIDLVVTSPPYPMIEMWDELFCTLNPDIRDCLDAHDGMHAFELMNKELDSVWKELSRVVKQNGFVCINIGDATRTIGKQFQLYSNHSRITSAFISLGFHVLPVALWKKSTNAPNKFMGSGMLPAGAYITLEHEYILVFRKGGKKEFKTDVLKRNRNESAFFWEERNVWFSDTWDLTGVRQATNNKKIRERNAAFPFELPYRLINMYSVKGDTVLDPFLGTGTTTYAAIAAQRNSTGIEYDENFSELIMQGLKELKPDANRVITLRIKKHIDFCTRYESQKGALKHKNEIYGFPVMTKQEIALQLSYISAVTCSDLSSITAEYEPVQFNYQTGNIPIIENETEMSDNIQLSLFG